MHETTEQAVVGSRGRAHITGDKDGDNEGVDGTDTRHDDRDERLHDEVGSEGTDTSNTDSRLCCAECGSNAYDGGSVLRVSEGGWTCRTAEDHLEK